MGNWGWECEPEHARPATTACGRGAGDVGVITLFSMILLLEVFIMKIEGNRVSNRTRSTFKKPQSDGAQSTCRPQCSELGDSRSTVKRHPAPMKLKDH